MYCSRCGTENNKGSKYCVSCGQDLNEISNIYNSSNNNDFLRKIKAISIIGIIFSFIFPFSIVGLILSIIGLVYNNKYKKENGDNTKYLPLNIIGLVFSIIQIIFNILVIFIIILVSEETKDTFVGKWNCGTSTSVILDDYYVTAEFKENGKFFWGKYGNVSNNNYLGTYSYYEKNESDIETQYYSLTLYIDDYTLNGQSQEDKSNIYNTLYADITVTDDEDAVIEITTTNKKYYCEKVE